MYSFSFVFYDVNSYESVDPDPVCIQIFDGGMYALNIGSYGIIMSAL